jgi:hypothetical protein
MQHTPGPWFIDEDADCDQPLEVRTESCSIACVFEIGEGFDGDSPSMRANAYLIAAAPELLEELKKWLAWAKDEGMQNLESTKMLIAKAEGSLCP